MTEIDLIQSLLKEASVYVREQYARRDRVGVQSKGNPNDLLTEADLGVQDLIVEGIRNCFPGDAIAAEERDFAHAPADRDARCWVIDPIDGTQNFVRGFFPMFGISIAFVRGGMAVAAGVALPISGGCFLAERGAGSFRDECRLRVSDVASASVARVEVDFSGPPERAETLRRASRIICGAGQIRCACATVVSLCQIAAGEMDGFVHVALHPWDYAAAQLIVEEAGGRATRLDGRPLGVFDGGKGALLSNGHIHPELLSLVDCP
ncbi:MAG TPA: inositol monophosphatase [Candidatus Hydrogenedentes bacterium]|nr:inositol monophosphatase [Candidatus Hydrogenedentota bacterium]HOV74422.1 inositol monophosphatase [Candidatus Hydrogenedentota bacterium]HPC16680.1 inositol monophosphatase [Candidatus Hydrogenedentota bacterium]HRT21996.1 inositol monophosphatase [Candidatus Hydrogenedentota bacterium]HRT65322.1 inositol monophosphatase [Candidatus Hydrogenedentota bacterium]